MHVINIAFVSFSVVDWQYGLWQGLTIQDLEDLLEDIKVYMQLEQGKNVGYWRDITIIAEEELNKLRKMDPNYQNRVQIAG